MTVTKIRHTYFKRDSKEGIRQKDVFVQNYLAIIVNCDNAIVASLYDFISRVEY
jgi:hypothetical protein